MNRTLDSIRKTLASKEILFDDNTVVGCPTVIGYEKLFRLRRFATQLNTFIVATDFGTQPIDVATIEQHSAEAFRYAQTHRNGWPRGLQSALGTISILISDQVGEDAIQYCEGLRSGKKYAGFAIPVVHDARSGQTHFFTKNPIWGRVYFPYFRGLIEDLLSDA